MKEYVIISGKGGTGKTSLTAAFASLADNPILCDTDVDAADLHLLLQPEVLSHNDFWGGNLAVIDQQQCTECGYCRELCRFDAIREDYNVDQINCEGCGVCVDLCPEKAINFPQQKSGEWFISDTRVGPMVHAHLGIAEENSGKLVSLIRQETMKIAEKNNHALILTDGPPGIGCPVIAAIGGATAVIIIVEPTVSGLHDIKRVAGLADHFKVPAMLCVNKYDINIEVTMQIEEFAKTRDIVVLPRIPFDPIFIHALVQGRNVIEYDKNSATAKAVRKVWKAILSKPTCKKHSLLSINEALFNIPVGAENNLAK